MRQCPPYSPVSPWLARLQNAYLGRAGPERESVDMVAGAVPLYLAAAEEERVAEEEGRQSLGEVYRYLACLASGKVGDGGGLLVGCADFGFVVLFYIFQHILQC